MAHISYTFTPLRKGNCNTLVYKPATEGVSLSEKQEMCSEGKCMQMQNFDVLSDRVTTRSSQNRIIESFCPEGQFHGVNKELFCGKTLLHIGNNLYCYENKDTEPTLIFSSMPDKKSLFCEFMSKMYIYCDRHVFSVNNLFEFVEEEPFAPVIYEDVAPAATSTKQPSGPYNLLAPRISVVYKESDASRFFFPKSADVTKGVVVYENDEMVEASKITLSEDEFRINRSGESSSRVVKVSYYLKDANEIEFDDYIFGCTVAIPFGGDINGGTRIFFSGNDKRKGYYYKSKLHDPLFVPSDEFEIIGNGSENITCMKKMYGDMIVFTVRTIYRMGFSLTDDGPLFTVKEIGNGIGCDCPDSVQLIDNRVVFLNSGKGVCIIDSTESTGEQNIKPISKNVLMGNGAGLLDNPKHSLKSATSRDFDRKYMLFVNEKAYIWDYDRSGFVDTGNYAKAQERLIWYLYDNIKGEAFFETDDGLISFETDGKMFYGFDNDASRNGVLCRYVSGELEEMHPFSKKFVTDMEMIFQNEKGSSYSLILYADGKKYYESALPLSDGKKGKIKLGLPKKALYSFAFEICGSGGLEIQQMLFEYMKTSE